MKAKIGNVRLSGSPDEIARVLKKVLEKADITEPPEAETEEEEIETPEAEEQVVAPKRKYRKALPTTEDIRLAELVRSGTPFKQACELLHLEPDGRRYAIVRKIIGKRLKNIKRDEPVHNEKLASVVELMQQGMSVKKAYKLLGSKIIGGADYKAIKQYIERNKIVIQPKPTRHVEHKPEHKEWLRKRALWVTGRAKELTHQYQYSWEKALGMASQEYYAKFGKKKAQQPPVADVPLIIGDTTANKVLMDMLKKIVHEKGTLKLEPDGKFLGLHGTRQWEELIWKIVFNAKEILTYIGVQGHLKFVEEGANKVLVYVN